MKVICIDETPNDDGEIPEVKECYTYTVVQENITSYKSGLPLYELAECLRYYAMRRFIPLSDIDEMELLENEILATNQE